MTKEQFEAHVRAEAEERYQTQEAEREADRVLFDMLNNEQKMRQVAYIAARMDHEWPLVAVIQQAYDAIDSLNDGGFGPLTSIEGVRAMSACIDALSPYTTKPIEP